MKQTSTLLLLLILGMGTWWIFSPAATPAAPPRSPVASATTSGSGARDQVAETDAHEQVVPRPQRQTLPQRELEAWVEDERMTIRGTLKDDRGKSLGGQLLFAYEMMGGQRRMVGGAVRSAQDGRFIVQSPKARLDSPVLLRTSSADSAARLPAEAEVRWGQKGVELVERHIPNEQLSTFALRVRRSDNGAAVQDYSFRFYADPEVRLYAGLEGRRYDDPEQDHPGAPDQQGISRRLREVRPGPHRLIVRPEGEQLQRSETLVVDIEIGEDRVLDVSLDPRTTLQVDVVDASGQPLAHSAVVAWRAKQNQSRHRGVDAVNWNSGGPDTAVSLTALGGGATDERGRCTIALRPGQVDLLVTGQAHAPAQVTDLLLRPGFNSHRVLVDPDARLTVRFGPTEHWKSWWPTRAEEGSAPSISLMSAATTRRGRSTNTLNGPGARHFQGLAAGRYTIDLRCGLNAYRGGLPKPVLVELSKGEHKEVTLQVPPIRCGSMEGTMTINGKRMRQGFTLIRMDDEPARLNIDCDHQGHFEIPRLRVGTYQAQHYPHKSPQSFRVHEGKRTVAAFSLVTK